MKVFITIAALAAMVGCGDKGAEDTAQVDTADAVSETGEEL